MRHIHPAALVGLIINFALGWIFFSAMESLDMSQFAGQDQEFMQALPPVLETIRTLFIGLLVFQALALGLIASGVRFGVILAVLAGFFSLPGSLVYCIGALFSHERVKYAAFAEAPPDRPDAPALFFHALAAKKMFFFSGAALILFFFLLWTGWGDVAVLFLGLGLAGLFLALRSLRLRALTLHDDYCAVTPGLFSRRLRLSYADVNLATLLEDESIRFQMKTPDGTATLVWSLRTVEPRERRDALEKLGAALAAHDVPLE
jgi:hypothetical protein